MQLRNVISLSVVLLMVILFSAVMLADAGYAATSKVGKGVAAKRNAGEVEVQPSLKATMERGKKVYEMTCLTCHQADGSGVPNLNPPLVKSSYVTGDQVYLINILLKGLNDEIEVNGEYFGSPMPAQPQLSDLEVADVLTYVRNSFGNKAKMITPAQVATERKKMK